MNLLDHGEKITTGLIWLGGLAAMLCFPLWMSPFVLLGYAFLVCPVLMVFLPVLVMTGIGLLNLLLWPVTALLRLLPSSTRRAV